MNHETSAMWTSTRSSSSVSASSKSFAVSGSIVNVSSSRRSTRPSSEGSLGSYGSNPPRSPASTSSPSSTASIALAGPSTRSSFALPRPGRTTARSPGQASPLPRLSSTSGTPGVKYGSPTKSLPRRATSTTTGSDLEETPNRKPGARSAEQQASGKDDQRVQAEGPGVHVGLVQVDHGAEEKRPSEHEQHDRDDGPGETAEQPFDHERPAHEPVGRADELHHLDLAPPGDDRGPDRVGDDERRRDDQHDDREHTHQRQIARNRADPEGDGGARPPHRGLRRT